MRSVFIIILLIFASAAQADIASKTYLEYQDVDLSASQRVRLMYVPNLGPVSTNIHYELSARSNGDAGGRFDRLNLKWGGLTLGRDAVSFGVGRIWSPNDLFKPFAPTEIDKDYKTGVDLVRYDRSLGETSDVTLLYTPLSGTQESYVGRLRGTMGNFGTSLLAGKIDHNITTYGFTFDGPIGGAGFRGSVNCQATSEGDPVYKFILGADYMFPNDLYTISEYYYDQGRHYLAFGYSLDFWSLWTTTGYVIGNLDDGSRLYWEEIDYSLSDESSIKSGVILSSGGSNSEYAAFNSTVYALLNIYL